MHVSTDEILKAETIARVAHAGQKEESTGDDYIRHIERVVALVEGNEAKAVAWLHDILEDTPITVDGLRAAGISERVIRAVWLLTRQPGETYSENYIPTIQQSGDPLAIAVKLADLKDHLRPNCPEQLRPRYENALMMLEGRMDSKGKNP
jgi:(p)ppGpp synthase/HD superfamily hydrolase